LFVFSIAFVQFASESDVEKAIKDLQDSDMDGRSLHLDYCGSKSQFKPAAQGAAGNKSFGECDFVFIFN